MRCDKRKAPSLLEDDAEKLFDSESEVFVVDIKPHELAALPRGVPLPCNCTLTKLSEILKQGVECSDWSDWSWLSLSQSTMDSHLDSNRW